MNRFFIFLLFFFSFACSGNKNESADQKQKNKVEIIFDTNFTKDYQLFVAKEKKKLLVLFPCFSCDAKHTSAEFNIVDQALSKGISVLQMNYNRQLFLTEKQKAKLADHLEKIFDKYHLPKKNIFIGGYSSGGNVSLLLSDYLVKTNHVIQPEGVFVVDPPVDLLGLYEDAQNDIEQNFSEVAVNEAKWIKNLFEQQIGKPETDLEKYEALSPYLSKTNSLQNVEALKNVRLRFYTEPDTVWWWENRKAKYEDMNAYYLEQLSEDLKKAGHQKLEYITTKNKGYRSNGERHPHSWSIVDKEELIHWMME